MPFALLIAGSPPFEAAIREGLARAEDATRFVAYDEALRAGAAIAVVAAEHEGDVAGLAPRARRLHERHIPVIWLYPERAETTLGRIATAAFPVRSRFVDAEDPYASARVVAEAVARIAKVGRTLR